jgi:hypothetical protein
MRCRKNQATCYLFFASLYHWLTELAQIPSMDMVLGATWGHWDERSLTGTRTGCLNNGAYPGLPPVAACKYRGPLE